MRRNQTIVFMVMLMLIYSGICLGQIKSKDCCNVVDIDGNIYKVVKIGNQEWMAENLKVTKYRNGDPIPTGYSHSGWGRLHNTETGSYCVYDDEESNADIYGYLYNWYAVDDSRNIAPDGWHIPTDAEWQKLVDYLGGSSIAGGKMKEIGREHWNSPNTSATNEGGFTALPGGYRNCNFYTGGYHGMGFGGYFWSSSDNKNFACHRFLLFNHPDISQGEYFKRSGFSVRCVRD